VVAAFILWLPTDAYAQTRASSSARNTDASANRGGHPGVQSTICDILRHPAFAGFARLILPWDDRAYDEDMRLARISSLLPYHSHVDPAAVTSALNRIIDDTAAGKTVFYRFYSEAQRQQQPKTGNTGLFFFRGRPGAPFAVVSPGGGFSYVGSVHEGFPYAEAISSKGYNAFVLKYRAGDGGTVANPGSRCCCLLHSSQCRHAWCQHQRLLAVGQFGWSENGGRDRFEWSREVWRRRRPKALSHCDGVHGAFGLLGR
jgi:hypothetical protein